MDIDFHRLNLTRGSSDKKGNNKPREFGSRMFQMGSNCSYEMGRDRWDHQRISKLRRYEDDFD